MRALRAVCLEQVEMARPARLAGWPQAHRALTGVPEAMVRAEVAATLTGLRRISPRTAATAACTRFGPTPRPVKRPVRDRAAAAGQGTRAPSMARHSEAMAAMPADMAAVAVVVAA